MNNRKYIYILLLSVLYFGCNTNEIELYNEEARINFASGLETKIFRDSDYVRNHLEYKQAVKVQIQGNKMLKNKDFCFMVDKSVKYKKIAEAAVEEVYTYNALDTNTQIVYVTVRRPNELVKDHPLQVNIKFDLSNPKHKFAPGRIDRDSCRIDVLYNIKPTEWNSFKWGEYSDGKYFFVMNVLKKTYSEIEDEDKDYNLVSEQYKEYLKKNSPILDDKGEEIIFP